MAKEYIEREAALEICKTEYQNRLRILDYCGDTVAWNIGSEIKAIPAADVAEVVHCEDCQSYELLGDAILTDVVHGICTYRPVPCGVKNNDFCSYGERKGDVENE